MSNACDIKLEGASYSVFYAEASKRPSTSLNDRDISFILKWLGNKGLQKAKTDKTEGLGLLDAI